MIVIGIFSGFPYAIFVNDKKRINVETSIIGVDRALVLDLYFIMAIDKA